MTSEISPFAELIGIKELLPDGSICLECEDRHCNEYGFVHGGVIFALADYAFGLHTIGKKKPCVTMDMNIRYIRPAQVGNTLFAHAECIHEGRTTNFYVVKVWSGFAGTKLVAMLTGNGHLLPEKK